MNIQPSNARSPNGAQQNAAPNAAAVQPQDVDAIAQRLGAAGPFQQANRSWRSFERPANDAGQGTLHASRQWLRASAPILTAGSIGMITSRYQGDIGDIFTSAERGIGWVTLPFSLVIDVAKIPLGLAGAGVLGAAGGFQRAYGAVAGRSDELALNLIFDSVMERMPSTLAILCIAGVETPDTLRRELNTGGYGRLLAVTLLHTAFVSRGDSDGTLRMNDGRTLRSGLCPRVGRPLLERVTDAQRFFRAHAPAASAGAVAERRFIAQWLPALSAALQGNIPADAPQWFRELVTLCEGLTERALALPIVQRRAGEIGMASNRVRLPVERNFIDAPGPAGRQAFNPRRGAVVQRPAGWRAGGANVQTPLREEDVLRSFHRMLVQAVASNPHVRREDYEALEPRAMLAAPSLALFEAAVASNNGAITSVLENGRTVTLTAQNCPRNLQPLFNQWQRMAAQLRDLNPAERDYLRWFLSMGDEGQDADRPWPLTVERRAELRHGAGDLCGLALVITRRGTYQSRLATDFDQVLDALPESIEAAIPVAVDDAVEAGVGVNADAAPTNTPGQQAGAQAFTRALSDAAQRNVQRANGEPLALVTLAVVDLMRSGQFSQPSATPETLPADLFALHEALAPVQQAVTTLNAHQFRALERLLGAPTGDLRFVDGRVENLAVLLTDFASNADTVPSLARTLEAMYGLLGNAP